jgi:rhamnose transport system substrate-binding protein
VLGINYFDVGRDGGQEAAKELGDVELIYAGPTAATVEQQIAVIDTLIAQHVDVLLISANDAHALIPTTKKAMQRGITVLSFDSGIAPEGRAMQVNAPHDDLVGANDVRMITKTIGGEGEIAILSATSQATNQNIWIEKMKEELKKPDYAKVTLVGVVYGDDAADKSYREAQGLIKGHPNLKGIISPTAVGIIGACRAVTDAGLIGKVSPVRDETECAVRRKPDVPALEPGGSRLCRRDVREPDRARSAQARGRQVGQDRSPRRYDDRS